jgi:peptidyl-prolyl cis-trans isomerase D
MLQSMRQLAHSWVVKGLMLFLALSFSIWGIGDIFRGNPMEKTVASTGDVKISVQQLNHLFEQSLAESRQRISPDLTSQQARQLGLLDKTLDNAVTRALIDQDIKRLGINVPPSEVLKLISDQPQFRTKDGKFNKPLFEQFLQSQQRSEQAFIAEGQQDMARQILLAGLSGSHDVPQTMVDALYKAKAQKRILDVVTVDASKLKVSAIADDKDLHTFYQDHLEQFTAPEYRGVTIGFLSTDDLSKDIAISDDDLKKEYDAQSERLSHPEQRDIVQVVLQDESEAKKLSAAARASGNLALTAKADGQSAVPLNQLEQTNLIPELASVVFAQHVGDVSDPVKTQLGWHVVQLKKITLAGKPDFETVKVKLREDMQKDQAIEAATKVVNQLDDQLAAGHSLDDIADELKLRLIKIPALDQNGLAPNGQAPSELPNKGLVIKDAFSQNSGETSPIEDDKSGHYFIVRTDEITPATPKPFDTVKAQVVAAWTAQKQMDEAHALAQTIAKNLQDGKPLSSIATQDGVTARASLPLSELGETDPLLPPTLIAKSFRLQKGQTGIASDGSKEVVGRLASIVEADGNQSDPRKNQIVGEIKQATNDELLDQYIAYLHTVFPVKINATLLEHLRQQDN